MQVCLKLRSHQQCSAVALRLLLRPLLSFGKLPALPEMLSGAAACFDVPGPRSSVELKLERETGCGARSSLLWELAVADRCCRHLPRGKSWETQVSEGGLAREPLAS